MFDHKADLCRAVRSLNTTRFGLYHSLYEWFNPLWMQDKQANLTTRNFVTEKVLPELYELVLYNLFIFNPFLLPIFVIYYFIHR